MPLIVDSGINYPMKLIDIIRENITKKMEERQIPSWRALSIMANQQEFAVKNIMVNIKSSPGIEILLEIANALDCSVEEMCGREVKTSFANINKDIWLKIISKVDALIKLSNNKINTEARAELYVACYEYNTQGVDIMAVKDLDTLLKMTRQQG